MRLQIWRAGKSEQRGAENRRALGIQIVGVCGLQGLGFTVGFRVQGLGAEDCHEVSGLSGLTWGFWVRIATRCSGKWLLRCSRGCMPMNLRTTRQEKRTYLVISLKEGLGFGFRV